MAIFFIQCSVKFYLLSDGCAIDICMPIVAVGSYSNFYIA